MTTSSPAGPGKRNRDEAAIRPETYPFWMKELVRFADLDINGHVNNIAFAIYAESGRAAFLNTTGLWSLDNPSRQYVLAHIEIDYLQELKYPADVRVGVRVLQIGRSSFQLGIGIFSDDRCMATARTVQVQVDALSKAPRALDDADRQALQPYLVNAGSP